MQRSPPNRRSGQTPDIVARTFTFGVRVTRLTAALWDQGGVGRVLAPQIVRAGTSVGAMVEEAQSAESRADFVSKLSIGLKEARETHFRLRVLATAGVLFDPELDALIHEADGIRRVLASIIVSTKRNDVSLRRAANSSS